MSLRYLVSENKEVLEKKKGANPRDTGANRKGQSWNKFSSKINNILADYNLKYKKKNDSILI